MWMWMWMLAVFDFAVRDLENICEDTISKEHAEAQWAKGRSLALHDYYDKHPWMYPRELHFLVANVRCKIKGYNYNH
ncbi:hypothetical protein ACN38_g1424 [Penicillium nordicum]|uniref:Uncharacterized protein n=1 Tax=Penicillium nordicum TaxID=229535 RepID=A0A0M8PBP5_9EURO|nr:hypothetical protein ACN38_g1424 [Penicillium nordicum]